MSAASYTADVIIVHPFALVIEGIDVGFLGSTDLNSLATIL